MEGVGVLSDWSEEHQDGKEIGQKEVEGDIVIEDIRLILIKLEHLPSIDCEEAVQDQSQRCDGKMFTKILKTYSFRKVDTHHAVIVDVMLVCIVEIQLGQVRFLGINKKMLVEENLFQ